MVLGALSPITLRSDYHVGPADEYQLWLAQISMKVCSIHVHGTMTHVSAGTIFVPQDFQTEDISIWLNANATPSPLGPDALKAGMDKVISLYLDDPSAGSPFGTGNQTFGTGSGYKREASICMSSTSSSPRLDSVLTGYCVPVGDIRFQAQRRFWTQTTVAPSYAYLFTDPQPGSDPAIGVYHSAELPYLFGNVSTIGPTKVANLSRIILDYWISFAVSLTPNDGKGTISVL